MRKVTVFFLAIIICACFTRSASAGHVPMYYPYEGILFGYTSTMPIPSGGDLRHYIISQSPYKQWDMWPEKSKMMKGTQPHGPLITVYVNEIASDSISNARGLDNNSIVVKENYNTEKELTAISVMYKVKGYNTEGGDWFWVEYDPKLNIILEGKQNKCIECHRKAENNDYIFTGKTTK